MVFNAIEHTEKENSHKISKQQGPLRLPRSVPSASALRPGDHVCISVPGVARFRGSLTSAVPFHATHLPVDHLLMNTK